MTGYFSCDASMDRETKVFVASAVNLKTGEMLFQKTGIANNITEAEEIAIYETLKEWYGTEHITIFSDNRGAVERARRKVLHESGFFKRKFRYIQIVWVERGDNFLADFFTKNILDSETAKENARKKLESYGEKLAKVQNIVVSDSEMFDTAINMVKARIPEESKKKFEIMKKKPADLSEDDLKRDMVVADTCCSEIKKYLLSALMSFQMCLQDKKGDET